MFDRPLCIATIFYIIGIIMGLYLENLSMVLFLCFVILIVLIKINKKICIYFFIIIIGFTYIKFIDYKYENEFASINVENEHVIEGIVVSDKSEKEYKDFYNINLKKVDGKYQKNRKIYILNIKKSKNIDLEYGNYIKFTAKIDIPSKARNYMGFDYQKYLKSKNIYANLINVNKIEVINKDKSDLFDRILNNIRNNIKERIYEFLPQNARELVIGIMIGDKSDLNEEIITNFKNSNLTHMLAVSGAHVSYIILGLNLLMKNRGSRFKKIFIICFLMFFIGITKFVPSVLRACFMAILSLVSSMIYRKNDIYTSIAFSCFIILAINPYSILDIAFQLSFGGTIGILLMYNNLTKTTNFNGKIIKYIISLIAVSLYANLIIIPIMAFQFNTISLTFWISNLLAGPFLGAIIILGFSVYIISFLFLPIAKFLSVILKYCSYTLINTATICSKIPFSSITIRTPYLFEIILYYISVYYIFNYNVYKKHVKNILSIFLIIILLANSFFYVQNHSNMMIYFIDVGQGDSTLIRTSSNKTILIDGGGSENLSFNVGEQTLLPYLLDRKISSLDYVLISHFDSDHCDGILYLMKHMKIKNIIISKQGKESANYIKFKNIVIDKKISIIFVKEGDRIRIDSKTYIDILFPKKTLISENILNNNSIVAKVCYNSFSILFTGDVEKIAEDEICREYMSNNKLKATILKVAHHGSKTSSTSEFINLVKPKIALIGVGEKNTFGHPNNGVIQRLKNMNIKIYRTDKMGEIVIRINNDGKIKINTALN